MTTVYSPTTTKHQAAHQRIAGRPRRGLRAILRPLVLAAGVFFVAAMTPTGDAAAQLNGDMLGRPHTYTTHYDDTLLDIAREARLGGIELMAANPGVDAWLPGNNVTLFLPTAHLLPDAPRKGIVINTAELRMYYFGDPATPLSFPIGVGRDGYLTPHGTTTIVRKKEKPSWYLTPSEVADHPELPPVIPPGEDNPLGEYAMYLGWPSYLIHGTNIPWGIGRRASRGCIRMYPENIEWLFQRVPTGTQVTVVDQPVKIGRMDGDLYIEVQPSSKQIDAIEESSKAPGPPDPLPLADWSDRILVAAGPDIERIDWPTVEKALADRQGFPIRIATAADHAGTPPPAPTPIDKPAIAAVALPASLAAATAVAATSSKPDAKTKPASASASAVATPTAKPSSSATQSQAAKSPAAKPATAKATAAKSTPPKSTQAKSGSATSMSPVAKPAASSKSGTSSTSSSQQRTASR